MVFIFVWKFFKRTELREKINAIEQNRVIQRKIMFGLSVRKNLLVSKLYIIFGGTLQFLKYHTVPKYWTKLTGIDYKE